MNPVERWLLWLSVAACGGSGAVYGWMKHLMRSGDAYAVVNHPWQPFFLKLHVATAPVLVFALGLVFSKHIWGRFRSGDGTGRRTGTAMLATALPMVATGYAVQVVADAWWLRALGLLHLALGSVWTAGFLLHRVATRAENEAGSPEGAEAPDRAQSSAYRSTNSAPSTYTSHDASRKRPDRSLRTG